MTLHTPLAGIDIRVFPASYLNALQNWESAVQRLPDLTDLQSYACPGNGLQAEPLRTGSAWLGPRDATKVLVLTSATHGIEGYAGSAIQVDVLSLMQTKAFVLPPATALLIVHALNPWGFSWERRCDADGIDLNRNFVDFKTAVPENSGYTALRAALFSQNNTQRQAAFAEWQRQHGRESLECAISGGQYSDPQGPFYGGTAPAHGRRVIEQVMQHYALPARQLAVIDLHTGLGPYGHGEIICDHAPDSDGAANARHWYGDAVTLPALGTSSSVPKSGLIDYAWHAIMDSQSCFVTLEFGTFSTDQLFAVILRDHLLWAETVNAKQRAEHRQLMRHHFCPADWAWREMVLFRARQVIVQALNGLSA